MNHGIWKQCCKQHYDLYETGGHWVDEFPSWAEKDAGAAQEQHAVFQCCAHVPPAGFGENDRDEVRDTASCLSFLDMKST